jgi:hypothetical protein
MQTRITHLETQIAELRQREAHLLRAQVGAMLGVLKEI